LANQLLVVHERLGTWARNLRARLSDWPLRLVETRSAADLEQALAGVSCPLVLIDAGTSPRRLIDDLDLTLRQAPDALTLVIDRSEHKGLPLLARQIGATHRRRFPDPLDSPGP
jgi:hypothetical protein